MTVTAVAIQPVVLNNVTVVIGDSSYEKAVSEFTLTPKQDVQTWTGGTPDSVFQLYGTPTWTVDLTLFQDYSTSGSFFSFLQSNAGTTQTITFDPSSADDTAETVTASVTIPAVPFGGKFGSIPSSSLSFIVNGQPTFTPGSDGGDS